MREVDAQNAVAYLQESGSVPIHERIDVQELSGGVSNIVLLVTRQSGERFVLKQARQKLRVPQPWFCGVERVLREIDVLRLCGEVLQDAQTQQLFTKRCGGLCPEVPRILFEDRKNFLYAMTAAPARHTTWKQQLLAGTVAPTVATSCAEMLAVLHGRTWSQDSVAQAFEDRQFFDDLRLDPYYRQIAKAHPSLAPAINALIDSVWTHRQCLVHGDFSPKNLLVWNSGLMLIDFEVGHFGDPAFDLGFFLTHLALKAIHHRGRQDEYLSLISVFLDRYGVRIAEFISLDELKSLEHRSVQNWAGCMLARVDGKSRVDYSLDVARVRQIAMYVLADVGSCWKFEDIARLLKEKAGIEN